MKKTEIILIPICALLLVLALLNVPAMGVVMALFYPILSTIYFWFGFALFNNIRLRQIFKRQSYANVPFRNIAFSVLMGISISLIPIGILFKIQFWPGTNEILKSGAYSAIFLSIIIQGFLFREKSQALLNTLRRGVSYGVIGFVFLLMTNNQLIDIIYCRHPDYAEVYKQHIVDPDNPVITAKKEDLEQEIWGMKPRPRHKSQPVEISVAQNPDLSLTTLTIDPNGSLEIPGYWQQSYYDELRNIIALEDTLGNNLRIRKVPPEYSIAYTPGMRAVEWVNAMYEYEKNAVGDHVEAWIKVVEDSNQNYIIVYPTGKNVISYKWLLGAKENFCYSFSLESSTLTDHQQIDFLKNLFVKN